MSAQSDKPLQIESIPVAQLRLDDENPRLISIASEPGQEGIMKAMWSEMAVSEVALSIAANGFFKEEPLFVIPQNPKEKDPAKRIYTVVEGNRRLTAVLLLTDDALRARIKATDLPELSAAEKKHLQELPVSIYPDHKSLWEYFGFRHVNGAKEWDSFSKAAYVAKVQREYKVPLEEISRRIGDQHSTVERIYRGYVLLEQAESQAGFDREDRKRNKFYFSHLYTAADYDEFLTYIGLTKENSLHDNPVKKANLPKLKEVMIWLFGSKAEQREPVVQKQFPDLGHLREVIGNPQALAALRAGRPLERAYNISLGDARRLQDSLSIAKDALQEGKSVVTTGYRGEPEVLADMAEITKLADSILREMQGIAEFKQSKQKK
jgi:hypothetical protein